MACKVHPDTESVAICMTCQQELCEECRQSGSDGKSYCAAHVPAAGPATDVEMPPMGDPVSMAGAATDSPILAGLCYLCWLLAPISFVIPIIVLAGDYKQSRFMRYHAFNGIFWGLALIVIGVLLKAAAFVAKLVGVPGFMRMPLNMVLWFLLPVALIASVMFLAKANNRQDVRIPAISDLADKQAK